LHVLIVILATTTTILGWLVRYAVVQSVWD